MNAPHEKPFLTTAYTIGAKLCRDAIWSEARCTWMGDSKTMVNGQPIVIHTTLGPGVYDGTAGVALFLSKLFHYTGERLFRRTAQAALSHALAHRERLSPAGIGSYYTGQLGIAMVAIEMGTLLQCPSFIEQGLAILPAVTEAPVPAQMLDVIAGSAGAIPTLLRLYHLFGDETLLQSTLRYGDHLLNNAIPLEQGITWRSRPEHDGTPPLCGFAHGAAGMGLALLELFAVTGYSRYRDGGLAAFAYEEACFDPTEGNYPDFRRTEGEPIPLSPRFMIAWCHGAPGIGIARTRAYELLPNDTLRDAAQRAAATTSRQLQTLQASPSLNYSLCHGAGGNAAFLLYASRIFHEPAYREVAESVGRAGIERYPYQHTPWMCGVAQGGETPGLMLGTAGIGYFYLSLAEEKEIPPIYL